MVPVIDILPGVLGFDLANPETVSGQGRGGKVIWGDSSDPVPCHPLLHIPVHVHN